MVSAVGLGAVWESVSYTHLLSAAIARETLVEPLEHAEPADIQIPSKSSEITKCSAAILGIAKHDVLPTRFAFFLSLIHI